MKSAHRVLKLVPIVLLGFSASAVAPATAAPPDAVVEKTVIDEVRLSPNLTQECGVPVTLVISGTRTFVTYPGREEGVVERVHSNVGVVATSEFGEVKYRHTGQWTVFITDDGRLLIFEAGQGPLGQKGRYLAEITDAGDVVIHQAATSIEEGIAAFCEVLNP